MPDYVQVFDLESGHSFRTDEVFGIIYPPQFSRDGRRLAVPRSDTIVRVWDMATARPVGPLLPHPRFVRRVDLSSDGRHVVSWADHDRIRFWDAESGEQLVPSLVCSLTGPPGRIWFGHDDRTAGVQTQDGQLGQIRLPTLSIDRESVPALVRLLTARQLDPDANGIVPLPVNVYRQDPEESLKAFRGLVGKP